MAIMNIELYQCPFITNTADIWSEMDGFLDDIYSAKCLPILRATICSTDKQWKLFVMCKFCVRNLQIR